MPKDNEPRVGRVYLYSTYSGGERLMKTFKASNAQARILTTELANPGTIAYTIPVGTTSPPADGPYIADTLIPWKIVS